MSQNIYKLTQTSDLQIVVLTVHNRPMPLVFTSNYRLTD